MMKDSTTIILNNRTTAAREKWSGCFGIMRRNLLIPIATKSISVDSNIQMLEVKAFNYDACGLFRVTHSHSHTPFRSVLKACR